MKGCWNLGAGHLRNPCERRCPLAAGSVSSAAYADLRPCYRNQNFRRSRPFDSVTHKTGGDSRPIHRARTCRKPRNCSKMHCSGLNRIKIIRLMVGRMRDSRASNVTHCGAEGDSLGVLVEQRVFAPRFRLEWGGCSTHPGALKPKRRLKLEQMKPSAFGS